jgi:hypothetical protein
MNAVAILAPLWEWEVVGKEVESLRAAMAGGDGFTLQQSLRVKKWAFKWLRLSENLKDFYGQGFEDQTIGYALYCIMEDKKILDWQYCILRNRYRDWAGYIPQINLVPMEVK